MPQTSEGLTALLLSRSIGDSVRIVYLVKNKELRVVSAITRAETFAKDVVVIDMGSTDTTLDMADQKGAKTIAMQSDCTIPEIARELLKLEELEMTLVIHLSDAWRLRDLPVNVNRTYEGRDINLALAHYTDVEPGDFETVIYADAELDLLAATPKGLAALAECSPEEKCVDLPSSLNVRVHLAKQPTQPLKRESLATASRFAQLFHWMLSSRHPLILFGLPGLVCFIIGFTLTGDVVDEFQSMNSITLGVSLATAAVTLIGLFAMMTSLMLYILGKQVRQIQRQYDDWPTPE